MECRRETEDQHGWKINVGDCDSRIKQTPARSISDHTTTVTIHNRQCHTVNTLPQRSQTQRCLGCQWRRLPVSLSCPELYWFLTPTSGTSSHKRLWPEPRLQTQPAPESGPSGQSPCQPGKRNVPMSNCDTKFIITWKLFNWLNAHHLFWIKQKNKTTITRLKKRIFKNIFRCQDKTLLNLHVLIAMQTLILGERIARVKSVTLTPSRWHTFWAAEGWNMGM